MIHPEFKDKNQHILQKNDSIPVKGTATMWTLMDDSRQNIHKNRLTIDTKGYMVMGQKEKAEVEVLEILGGLI